MRRTRALVAGLLLALGSPALLCAASTPQLLYDLDSVTPAVVDPSGGGTISFQLGVAGPAQALFVVTRLDPPGFEVWVSDGSSGGTRPVASFCQDWDCYGPPPRPLASVGAAGLFLAPLQSSDDEGVRLWRTDGTVAGTVAISVPFGSFTAAGGTGVTAGGELLFSACTVGNSSCSLWRTDGTAAGTRSVASVASPWFPLRRTIGGGVLFFGAARSTVGLWRSDGTRQGTVLLHAFPSSGDEHDFTVVGDRLFFMGGEYGGELWVSDGTAAGTRRLARLAGCGHYGGCGTALLGGVGDTLFLSTAEKLWRTDGSPKGLVAVDSLPYGNEEAVAGGRLVYLKASPSGGFRIAVAGASGRPVVLAGCPSGCPLLPAFTFLRSLPGGRALLVAVDATGNVDLWATDGTAAGTVSIGHRASDLGLSDFEMRSDGTRAWLELHLYDRDELWVTDGTPNGTRFLADLAGPGAGPWPSALDVAFAAGRAFFAAYDEQTGIQPWTSDGTPAGTARLVVIEARGAGSRPRAFASLPHGVAFRACDGSRTVLWASDGAPGRAPDLLLAERDGCGVAPDEGPLLAAASRVFFTERDNEAGGEPGVRQLWASDGTPNGTMPLTALDDQVAGEPFLLGGKVCFFVQPLAAGAVELWESDGTPAGTRQRFALEPEISDVREVRSLGDGVYFAAALDGAGVQFFASDGTGSGTRRFTLDGPEPLPPEFEDAFEPPRFTRLGEWVIFTLCTRSETCGLWRTRGTPETTALIVEDAAAVFNYWRFAVLGDVLLYWSDSDLWRTDGTPEGTALVTTLDTYFSCDPQLTVVGGRAFFVASDDDADYEHGEELWVTDGTATGTHLFADLAPGPMSSSPSELTVVGERLWLSAGDREHGREPRIIDPAATDPTAVARLAGDLAPGRVSSSPTGLTLAGDRVYFAADDGLSGREPWVAAAGEP